MDKSLRPERQGYNFLAVIEYGLESGSIDSLNLELSYYTEASLFHNVHESEETKLF